jgi:hypothetical protein
MFSANLTHHAARRLQQRGIPEKVLPLLLDFGEEVYDHHGARTVFFDHKARQQISRTLGHREYKRLHHALDTYLVVDNNDCIVTIGHRTHRINRA